MTTFTPLLPGPLMIDVQGLTLTPSERERLAHPLVGGLIFFTRNYQNPAQLSQLTAEIRAARAAPLLLAIDHEGGRVQRCRDGFTRLPPMRRLGAWWERDAAAALDAARAMGYVLAAELRQCGVDLSFTPILDLDWARSGVIGDRAFHPDPAVVTLLAGALIEGLRHAGMASCGKHFPGHGWSEVDSHFATPVDERNLDALAPDLEPYRRLPLDAVMPSHVIYSAVDDKSAIFSPYWHAYLRKTLHFDGAVLSDDLSMEGASTAGGVLGRVKTAWEAGCDMLLVCNSPDAVGEVLEQWHPAFDATRSARIAKLIPNEDFCLPPHDPLYQAGVAAAAALLAEAAPGA